MTRFATMIAISIFLASCGGASAYEREVEPELDVSRDESAGPLAEEQSALDDELSSVLALTEVDCQRACDLSTRICDLGARICTIASRHPSDAELGSSCQGAQGRCDRGRERAHQRCTCEEP